VRKLYVGYVKSWTWPPDETGYISSSSDGMGRRLTSVILSPDFVHWTTPARCGVPWADDFPSLEFYGCRPKARGNQMQTLQTLRDRNPAFPETPAGRKWAPPSQKSSGPICWQQLALSTPCR
jgi:hypothetical protein